MTITTPKWDISQSDALGILKDPANHSKLEVCEALHALDQDTIFSSVALPKVHLTLPKQKALKRITREMLLRSPFVFKPTTSRVDGTVAMNAKTGDIIKVYPQHTRDACEGIDMFNGVTTYKHNGEKKPIPHVALVGLDGLHNQRLLEGIKSIAVTKTFQTTTAEFVAAAKDRETLENLGEQDVIVVAKSYAEIYKDWHRKCFPHSKTRFREVEGGSEGRVEMTPGAEVVVDITDSGKSLVENGLNFVTWVSSAAPVLCRHRDLHEQFSSANAAYVDELAQVLARASEKAFPNAPQFEPCDMKEKQDEAITRIVKGEGPRVLSIQDFLAEAGKTGERDKPTVEQEKVEPPEGYGFYYKVSPVCQRRFEM